MEYRIHFPSYPYIVGWSITNKCNLHCLHCNMDSGAAWNDELTAQECKRIIDDLAEHGVRIIMFTGGEPLTRTDFFEICDYAVSRQIHVSFTTNSLLLTDEMIDRELYKFQSVRVSIDSIDEREHDRMRNRAGVFQTAVSNIRKMRKRGYSVSISTCVSKRNRKDLERMADFFAELGITKWCLPLLSPDGRGKELADEILSPLEIRDFLYQLREIKRRQAQLDISVDLPYAVLCEDLYSSGQRRSNVCPAGVSELTIFANGDVSPCFAMVTSAGNLRKEKLEDIWRDSPLFQAFRDRSLLKGKCRTCEQLMQCGGGCRANPFILHGDYLGEDALCWK